MSDRITIVREKQISYIRANSGIPGADGADGADGVAGPQGPQGIPGPTEVSTDAGNITVLGTDSKVLTPGVHPHVESDITDLDKYTQAQVDASVSGVQASVDTHAADNANPHVVNHSQLADVAANKTHTELDNHVDDATLHYTEASIDHDQILNNGAVGHPQIDNHILVTPNPHNITKATVGLGNVDNTSDADKPVSIAGNQANALLQPLNEKGEISGYCPLGADKKVPLVNLPDSAVGVVSFEGRSGVVLADGTDYDAFYDGIGSAGSVQANLDTHEGIVAGNPHAVTHAELSDSGTNTHVQLDSHLANITTNPHQVTKSNIALGNVDNTADLSKPVSSAQQTALDAKQDLSEKAANDGYCPLDSGGLVPAVHLGANAPVTSVFGRTGDVIAVSADYAGLYDIVGTAGTVQADLDGHKAAVANPHDVTHALLVDVSLNYTHDQLDAHVDDVTLHFTEASVDHLKITNAGVVNHGLIDNHVLDSSGNPHSVTKSQVGLGNVDDTTDMQKPISTAQASALAAKEDTANKGAPEGYCPLEFSLVPARFIDPATIATGQNYRGTWDAATNTPQLELTGPHAAGDYWIVSVAGTSNQGGIADWKLGDWIFFEGPTTVDFTKVPSSIAPQDVRDSLDAHVATVAGNPHAVTHDEALGFSPVQSHANIDAHIGNVSTNPHQITPALIGAVNLSGDVMTGPLEMNADPVKALGTATKQYVDTQVGTPLRFTGVKNTTYGALVGDFVRCDPANAAGGTFAVNLPLAGMVNDDRLGVKLLSKGVVAVQGAVEASYSKTLGNDTVLVNQGDVVIYRYVQSYWVIESIHLAQPYVEVWEADVATDIGLGTSVITWTFSPEYSGQTPSLFTHSAGTFTAVGSSASRITVESNLVYDFVGNKDTDASLETSFEPISATGTSLIVPSFLAFALPKSGNSSMSGRISGGLTPVANDTYQMQSRVFEVTGSVTLDIVQASLVFGIGS